MCIVTVLPSLQYNLSGGDRIISKWALLLLEDVLKDQDPSADVLREGTLKEQVADTDPDTSQDARPIGNFAAGRSQGTSTISWIWLASDGRH
ncbi:hypothetical protein BDR04DRAFT_1106128 [Suillus decipiens]|nr:hypothetical protein BDR04DRAFT_1106128 [Suillus decipiens]